MTIVEAELAWIIVLMVTGIGVKIWQLIFK